MSNPHGRDVHGQSWSKDDNFFLRGSHGELLSSL
jgi:hypothetical protein